MNDANIHMRPPHWRKHNPIRIIYSNNQEIMLIGDSSNPPEEQPRWNHDARAKA
jgi:hypothetical protein